jgi:hypothetical protein
VITGYNTDVEYDGVVYHIQTEDKGLKTPLILSLVYTGGEILASRRTPYDDLISSGFDERVLAERLDRQHKLICAAIKAGRIEDLKRLGAKKSEKTPKRKKPSTNEVAPAVTSEDENETTATAAPPIEEGEKTSANVFAVTDTQTEAEGSSPLSLTLLDEVEMHGGDYLTLRVQVNRTSGNWPQPVSQARVVLKILGTTFEPASTFSITNKEGMAVIFATLPQFQSGRAAILLRAEVDGDSAELRRVVLPP